MEREGTATTRPLAQSFIIKRPRLTKLLDESEARIILLVAPAGYGKTTLAREWLSGRPGPVAWFSTTSVSTDVAALSIGIAEELDIARGDDAKATANRLASLTAVQQHPDALARSLARSCAAWPPGLVLTIDDYHHLVNSPPVEAFVGMLAHLLPVTFVITSRSRPTWADARAAIYGEAFEVGPSKLAMTDDEASAVLRRSSRAHSENSIELAQGWPAIIGLAAHTKAHDLPDVIPARLYEFLAADLVGAAPQDVQEALGALAVTGVADLSTALDLLGPGSAPVIDEAERRGLLTFGDADRLTLHPLLGEFLIARLRREPAKLSALVSQLVPTLVASRRWNECLVAAEAVPNHLFPLEHILESALEELLSEGRVATVGRWIQLARKARIDAPIVDLAEGEVALRAGDYERASALGSRAARAITTSALRTRSQLLAARAAHFASHSDTAAEWFRLAEKDASSSDTRLAAIWGQFVVQFEDEAEEMRDTLSRFTTATDGSVEHELRSAQGRMLVALSERSAANALDASLGGVALLSLPSEALTRLATLNQHAAVLVWSGRYREALEACESALAEAELACIDFAAAHIQVAKAGALVGLRRFSSAQQILALLTRRLPDVPDQWMLANLPLAKAKLLIGLGDLKQADDCLAFAPASRQCAAQRAEHEGYRGLIAAARGLIDEGEAWACLSEKTSNHVEGAAFPAVTRAIIAARIGTSLEVVCEHFQLVLSTGLNDAIVTACRACPELAVQLSQTRHRDGLAAILTESRDAALAAAAGVPLPRSARKADGLSPRELEVYELIVQGRTNREISQILFIAESTTKVHVRHILEKLGVRSRIDAVRLWRLDGG